MREMVRIWQIFTPVKTNGAVLRCSQVIKNRYKGLGLSVPLGMRASTVGHTVAHGYLLLANDHPSPCGQAALRLRRPKALLARTV